MVKPGAAVSGKIVRSEELYKQVVLIAPEKIEQIRSWPSPALQPGVKRSAMILSEEKQTVLLLTFHTVINSF